MKGNWVITGTQPALFLQGIIILRQGQGGGVLSNTTRGLGTEKLQCEPAVGLAPEPDQKIKNKNKSKRTLRETTIIRNDKVNLKAA